ncbi:hypothetical protein ACP70R_007728 [Stipagrostis hirtigluma subsp. patula]
MEGRPMVCYSTGAINSVIEKLTKLVEVHPMVEGLLQDLQMLQRDLMDKFAGGHATDEQVKAWMKQVRELVYDIEDWLDPLLEGGGDDSIVPEIAANFRESVAEMERQIKEFKAQIQEARDRCTRYDLLHKAPNSYANLVDAEPSEVTVDCGCIWEEKTVLVGLDGPKSELENHLMDERKKLKVVSILGLEGHGKTTLAKEIYGKVKGQFECQAFVSVEQNTSTRAILMDIIRQVHRKMHPSDFSEKANCDEQQLITYIWEFLDAKRYFIFIDDIRSMWAWRVINAALPNNNLGSRILTTTAIKDLATSCCRRPSDVVYHMKSLNKDDSRSLLLGTISVRKEERPIDFENVCEHMLDMCGGLPLAIIITAGLLTKRSSELGPSKVLEKSMLFLMDQCSMSEGMRKILDISFADLPEPVKSCFLYLSAFPTNYSIKKDCLIRRWVTEGLIPQRDHKSSWETGESYFKELLTRRLIQAVFDDHEDQAVGCTIHGVIHEFIASISSKMNFITMEAELSSGLVPCDTIRRFSIDCSKQYEINTLESCSVHLCRVRSLTISRGAKLLPDLSAFGLIRVLDVEDNNQKLSYDQLERIGTLSLLRYLGLRGIDHIAELPREIGQLEHLTTLDVRQSQVRSLPIFTTTKLVSLLADDVQLPRGMGKMQELQEVSTIKLMSADSVHAMAELVDKSKLLRMLGVRFYEAYRDNETHRQAIIHFLDDVAKSSLQCVYLDGYPCHAVDLLLDYGAHTSLGHLRKFMLRISYGSLHRVPEEMASLVELTHLHVTVRRVNAEGLRALGKLPNLVLLNLTNSGTRELCVISKDGFQCLKVFWFECSGSGRMRLHFKEGAMPQLRRLHLKFNVMDAKSWFQDFGIQHLCCLVHASATINCIGATAKQVETVEAAVTDQISGNPNNPLLDLNREFEDLMKNDDMSFSLSETAGVHFPTADFEVPATGEHESEKPLLLHREKG